MNETTALHAHLSSETADCDGRYTRSWMVQMDAEDHTDEFGEFNFEARVLGLVVSTSGMGGNLSIETGTEDEREWKRLDWREPTEEGYRYVEALLCRDACVDDEPQTRDHSAEAAGY